MVRKLSWVMAALLALGAVPGAFALGLGDIDLHSALNQPLNAEIDLLSVRSGEADSIRVTLGSPEDFSRAGLDRPYLLTQLRFAVVEKGGRPVLHITTAQPVREPFLDFLIQVTWRGGELLREYTVLLDPPVLMPASAPVIAAPVTRPSAAPAARAPSGLTGDTYSVGRNETLWGIANRTRPHASVSVEQMMQALLRANPDDFIDNNINKLKAGQILRIPSRGEIDAISDTEARRMTREQNAAWRGQRAVAAPAPTLAAPQPAAKPAPQQAAPTPPPAAKPTPAPEEQARLKVVAPKPEETAPAAVPGTTSAPAPGAEAAGEGGDAMRKEIALANEAVEVQRQETEELRNRLADLEQQIAQMQKLIALKDAKLADLQTKGPGAAASGAEQGLLDNPATLALIGVVAVVLAALLWIAMRRRQMTVMPVSPPDVRSEPRTASAAAPAARNPAPAAGGVATAAAVRAASQAARPVTPPAPEELAAPELPPAEADPLSEADIYLAYGRYQQAEDLVREAMARDRRPELKVKLLEIYYAARNATAFEDTARALRDEIGAEHVLWPQVVSMGREICPYSVLFPAEGDTASNESFSLAQERGAPARSVPESFDFTPAAASRGQAAFDLGETHGETGGDTLDEVGTKLDLARAYVDMGDPEGARSILEEVLQEGSEQQKNEAQQLLKRIAS